MSFLDGPGPRVIAHRGLAIEAPENTLLAFLKALTAGATHLETDVHASADGVAVVCHDPDLTRVAGRPARVADLRMSELRRIDLGGGQVFSSLAETLDTFPEARFNLDIKDERAAASAVDAIRSTRAIDRVLVTSFSRRRRESVSARLPGVATSPSVPEFAPALLAAKAGLTPLVRRALHPFVAVQVPERQGPLRVITARTVRAVHAAGAEVHVWTVNDVADMERLLDLGVDGIVTDRCDVLAALVASRGL
ncbi:glycerophosphoryl diester phosphodiesterase [Leifsonia sp. LS1]|uniref:glycerophosphodiester phosphodiesterase n=1 Tax=unclassified Leifsonia TaxID=2663824 RepID=UPI001CBB1968|nr:MULTISPECIES: glycerophosphodiester phosphodiesterase [unclassified Leifsonia]UAJ77831.1 glycerophosphodiester phosphodiesterase [Leifsonia sp. ZF2019]GIT81759.1 glycerophosphoryl diester phosphodiesterase [Leifsonia sp. LS1]